MERVVDFFVGMFSWTFENRAFILPVLVKGGSRCTLAVLMRFSDYVRSSRSSTTPLCSPLRPATNSYWRFLWILNYFNPGPVANF